jgi:hypothetical protein
MAENRAYQIGVGRAATRHRLSGGRHREVEDRGTGRHRAAAHSDLDRQYRPAATRSRPIPVAAAAAAARSRPIPATAAALRSRPIPAAAPRSRGIPTPWRRTLPSGLATLLAVLAGATAVSGWFAASGAVAFAGMIAH